jgi:dTDP-4-dehydrorhamnose reductase
VDGAEKDFAGACVANGSGVGALAGRCREVGATLVHYSTDYVFNGRATRPYRTDDPRDPLNAYGKSKALGEEAIEASGCSYLMVRTSWLYAPWGKNFVRTIAGLVKRKESIRVVDDQRGRPTSCEPLAETTLRLMEERAEGMCHGTDGGECTWFEFAREIARLVGSSCRVEPCTTAEFPRPAKRPGYSVLDLSKTEELIGPRALWQVTLADVIPRLEGF